jgi:hypothetical protein
LSSSTFFPQILCLEVMKRRIQEAQLEINPRIVVSRATKLDLGLALLLFDHEWIYVDSTETTTSTIDVITTN